MTKSQSSNCQAAPAASSTPPPPPPPPVVPSQAASRVRGLRACTRARARPSPKAGLQAAPLARGAAAAVQAAAVKPRLRPSRRASRQPSPPRTRRPQPLRRSLQKGQMPSSGAHRRLHAAAAACRVAAAAALLPARSLHCVQGQAEQLPASPGLHCQLTHGEPLGARPAGTAWLCGSSMRARLRPESSMWCVRGQAGGRTPCAAAAMLPLTLVPQARGMLKATRTWRPCCCGLYRAMCSRTTPRSASTRSRTRTAKTMR